VSVNCRQFRPTMIDRARGLPLDAGHRRALLAHAETCAACARFLDSQMALSAAMTSLAAEEPPDPARYSARVMAEFDRAHRLPAWRWAIAACFAAAVFGGAVRTVQWARVEPPQAAAEAVDTRPFLNIPYTVPLAPEEQATILRTRIPAAALISAGFRVPVSDPAALIDADVLVSQDGRARAIRPLSIPITN